MNKNSGYKVHWMMDSHEYGRLESVDTHPGDVQPGNGLYIWALILVVKSPILGSLSQCFRGMVQILRKHVTATDKSIFFS